MVFKIESQKITIALLMLLALVVAGCQTQVDTSDSNVVLTNSQQVLGFAVLSSVEELRTEESVDKINNTDVNSMLYVANTFLGDISEFNVDIQEGSLEGYENTMIITYTDRDNNVNAHAFHYNETVVEREDDEVESLINGIILVNGVEYTLEGKKEAEEDEYEYDLIAYVDDENYLTIKYEVETESDEIEKEFKYERFVNNQLVYRMEIEFEEEEDGEREINIKYLDGDYESEYSFESEIEDGREEIKVEYKVTEAGVVIEEREIKRYENV